MIYPPEFPAQRSKEFAERIMYDAFSGLPPDDFDIFYNVEFSGEGPEEKPDYEIDFIVADLRNGRLNGIACIEVKGGIIRYNADSSWTQNGKKLTNSPTNQVMSAMYNLVKRYPDISRYVPFGWMLCFPDGASPGADHLPPKLKEAQIIDKPRIPHLKETMIAFFDDLYLMLPERDGINMNRYDKQFKAALVRECNFVLTLGERMASDEKVFIQLTENQAELLRRVQINPKMEVFGTAGSGKTILAKQIAEELFEEGYNVLFLCFNSVLASNIQDYFSRGKPGARSRFLDDLDISDDDFEGNIEALEKHLKELEKSRVDFPEPKNKIKISTFHSFARSVIDPVDAVWWHENFHNPDFWDFDISAKIEEINLSLEVEPIYDVVIIDEGQDFMEIWFESANYYLKPDGKYYIFRDDFQNINKSISRNPFKKLFFAFPLIENCRCTSHIVEKLSDILKTEILSMPGIPLGEPVRYRYYKSKEEQQTMILYEIRSLLEPKPNGENQVKPEDILILMNTDKSSSCLGNTKGVDHLPLVEIGGNGIPRRNAINYSHIRLFKGLEANIVFIIDTDKVPYDEKVLYTQASRAKHLLYIFEKQE